MLPLPRDSTALTPTTLSSIEADSTRKAERIVERVGSPTTIYVAFAGSSYAQASAHLFHWILRQLTEKTIYIGPVEAFLYHTLAYHDEPSLILLFAEPGSENIIARTADAARITGTEFLVVTQPLPDIIAERVGRENLVEVASPRPSIHYVLVAAKSAARLAEMFSSIRVRVERLSNELSNISSIYESLIDKYSDVIPVIAEMIAKKERIDLYASTTMLPPAYILAGYTNKAGVYPISSLPVHVTSKQLHSNVIALLTDIEADILKEVKFKVSMYMPGNSHIVEFIVHTDPLTAPIYGSLVVEHAFDRAKQASTPLHTK